MTLPTLVIIVLGLLAPPVNSLFRQSSKLRPQPRSRSVK